MAIVLRAVKGAPLTSNELDGNFTDLDGRVDTLEVDVAAVTLGTFNSSVLGTVWTVTLNDTVFTHSVPVATNLPAGIATDATSTITLDTGYAQKYLRTTSASAVTVNVPPESTAEFAIRDEVHIRQVGAGQVTIVAGSGVTVNPPYGGTLVMAGAHATVTLKKVDTDVWDLIGQVVSL